MSKIHQDVSQLTKRVEALEEALALERKERKHQFWQVVWKLRRYRAAIIRLEFGVPGEKWHVGREYTRGTWLLIPGKPKMLMERMALQRPNGKRPRSPAAPVDLLTDEDIASGRRNGIPASVGPDAGSDSTGKDTTKSRKVRNDRGDSAAHTGRGERRG